MLLAPLISRHPKLGRWIYAAVSTLGAVGFTAAFFSKLGSFDSSNNNSAYEFILYISAIAFISGLICWPKHKRGTGRMALAGIATVATAFLLFPIVLTLLNGASSFTNLGQFLQATFGMLLLGSIFTLGIPYGVGIGLSFLFIDVDQAIGDTQD